MRRYHVPVFGDEFIPVRRQRYFLHHFPGQEKHRWLMDEAGLREVSVEAEGNAFKGVYEK